MKLKRLHLIDGGDKVSKRYKSLEPFNQEFAITNLEDKVDPICLVGINGSGKSNLLELIAEIFFYLESHFLKYIPSSNYKKSPLKFEIEYYIKVKGVLKLVTIKRTDSKDPEFFLMDIATNKETEVTDSKSQEKLLPKRIIGYSSGLNETLSTPFKISRSFYAEQVGIQAIPTSKDKLDPKDVKLPRLMYMDYETNELIVVANYLFKTDKQLALFKELLRIKSLHSFRIIIQFNHSAAPKGGIKRTQELDEDIQRLVTCSTTSNYIQESDSWILDYYICEETKRAFKKHFVTAQSLFVAMYRLTLLNPLCVKAMHRKWAIRNEIFPSDKAFRVDQLRLNIDEPNDTIDYIGISDGEHQFIHILGTSMLFDEGGILYLLDEPETHYNPKWRAEFISSLNRVIKNHAQEYLITTHSPFLLSDTRGYNVFVFRRDGDKVWFEPIGFETFGSSFQILLAKAFNRSTLISELALTEIKDIEKEWDLNVLMERTGKLGESFEKQFLLEKINRLIIEKNAKK